MSKKQPALITRYKAACAELEVLREQHTVGLEKLRKAEEHRDMYSRSSNERRAEIDEIHAVLDAMPNPPIKRVEGAYSDLSLMTRFAVFLANRPA